MPALGAEDSVEQSAAAKLIDSGLEAASQGALIEADESLRGALAACRAGGDERCALEALLWMAPVTLHRGSLEGALAEAQEAAALAHRLRDRPAQGESYLILARALAEAGRAEEARSSVERAMAVAEELKLVGLKSAALTVMGEVAQAQGKPVEACRAYGEALEEAPSVGRASLKAAARMGLGSCLLEEGEFGRANEVLEEAFLEALRVGDKLKVARILRLKGRLEAHMGEAAQAEELFVEALGKLRSIGASAYSRAVEEELKRFRAEASLPNGRERASRAAEARERGLKSLEAGDTESALKELRKAVDLTPYDPEPRLVLARAYRTMGKDDLAEEEDRYASAVSGNNSPFDLTSKNPRYLDYFDRAHRQVERVFVVPEGVEAGELQGSCRVVFTVERSGRLKDASVETTSGSPVLDLAALTTLRLAEPFEPFPGGVSRDEITIVVRFIYEPEIENSPPKPHSG